MSKYKIYCAGPLFNPKEKEEMLEIATVLEQNDFETFLPQRDGLEYAGLINVFKTFVELDAAMALLNKAIFALDVYQILASDGLVLNMNGRVPDEGATVEAGIAWRAGKHVVVYKNDVRALLNGNDNPLLSGLANFIKIQDISKIPQAFVDLFSRSSYNGVDTAYDRGEQIAKLKRRKEHAHVMYREMKQIFENE